MDMKEFIKQNKNNGIDEILFDMLHDCILRDNKFTFTEKNVNILKKYIDINILNNLEELLKEYKINYEKIELNEVQLEDYYKNKKIISLNFNDFKFFFMKVLNKKNENFLKLIFNFEIISNNYFLYGFRLLVDELKNKNEEIENLKSSTISEVNNDNNININNNIFYIIKEDNKFFLKTKEFKNFEDLKLFINSNKFIYIKFLNNPSKIVEHLKISLNEYLNNDESYNFISLDIIENCLNDFIKIENNIQNNLKKIKQNKKTEEKLINLNYEENKKTVINYENTYEENNLKKVFIPPPPPPLPSLIPSSSKTNVKVNLNENLNENLNDNLKGNLPPPLIPVNMLLEKNKLKKTSDYPYIKPKPINDLNSLFFSLKTQLPKIREKKRYSSSEDEKDEIEENN